MHGGLLNLLDGGLESLLIFYCKPGLASKNPRKNPFTKPLKQSSTRYSLGWKKVKRRTSHHQFSPKSAEQRKTCLHICIKIYLYIVNIFFFVGIVSVWFKHGNISAPCHLVHSVLHKWHGIARGCGHAFIATVT